MPDDNQHQHCADDGFILIGVINPRNPQRNNIVAERRNQAGFADFIASADAVTEQSLADIAALAAERGIEPAALRPVLELALAKGGLESRFDMLQPATFSTLWYIKMKGKAAEERGESTDELWRDYWRVFEAAARRGR